MSQLPADTAPFSPSQFEKMSNTLETLINLILPLHQLLEAQEALEDGAANRLRTIMESLAAIAASLEASANGLTRLSESELFSPELAAAVNRIEVHQHHQNNNIAVIEQRLQILMDWLGTPPHAEAGPS